MTKYDISKTSTMRMDLIGYPGSIKKQKTKKKGRRRVKEGGVVKGIVLMK